MSTQEAMQTVGIHHITSFARDPQGNVDFYAGILGLRLVKRTINFDAPEVYHLYFGDEAGSPGTIVTFFPWPGSRKGRIGGGQVGTTTFAIPPGAAAFWEERLRRFGIPVMQAERFGETYVQFNDNEGLRVELVERAAGPLSSWSFGGVPAHYAIKGFGGALLLSVRPEQTMRTLQEVLGLERLGSDQGVTRFRARGELGNLIDVREQEQPWGAGGAGTVHHIAWRAADAEQHKAWRAQVAGHGFEVTPVIDRQYFDAIYFRELGGILFEIATDPPGFAHDEAPGELGGKLLLPPWYEERRAEIEANLQPIEVRELQAREEEQA